MISILLSLPTMSVLVHKGRCFCGSISYQVTGEPVLTAFCHCTRCQAMNGCPFVWTLHFPSAAFEWTHSEPHLANLDSYVTDGKPWKTRYRCKTCGTCLSSHNSKTNRNSVWGAHFERDEGGKTKHFEQVKPTAHMFYGTRIVSVEDDLSKWEGYEAQSARIA